MNNHQTSIIGITGKDSKSLHFLANLYYEPFDSESVLTVICKLSHKPNVKWKKIYSIETWVTSMDESIDGDIVAVDMDGLIYKINKSTFNKLDLNCPEGFNDVFTHSNDTTFAISLQGRIVKLKGTQFETFEDTLHRRLNAIDGLSNSIIYVAGDNGTVFYFNGNEWKEIQTPTNQNILSVHCVSENEIYFGGTQGTLLKWNGDEWKCFKKPKLDINLVDLTFFDGDLYISTGKNGIYIVKNDKIEKYKELVVYKLQTINKTLYGIGNRMIAQYDGKNWWGGNLDI